MNLYATCLVLLGLWAIVATAVATWHSDRAYNLQAQNDALHDDIVTYRFGMAALGEHIEALEARRTLVYRRWWKRASYRRLAALPKRITVGRG